MSKRAPKPSLRPKHLHEFAWWYEDERGIIVVQEARKPNGEHLSTEQVRIPWEALVRALNRCRP